MRALARWGALSLLAVPLGTGALGLGEIELNSALHQPFRAQIELVSATPEEVEGLRVDLASAETFQRYGLERPSALSSLEFRVGRNAQGRDVIFVSSNQTISDPFLTMLVEASWPRGRLLREYTVLLDLPVLLPAPSVADAPRAPTRTVPESSAPGGSIERQTQAAPPAQTAPAQTAPAQTAPRPAQAAAPAPAPRAASATPGSYGPVQRSETLWAIAEQFRPSDVTMNQMMVAIYEANPQAFGSNMNNLLVGTSLRIPDAAALANLSAAAATAEVQRQNESWSSRTSQPQQQQQQQQQARLRLVPPGDELETSERPAAGGAERTEPAAAPAAAASGASAAARSQAAEAETAGAGGDALRQQVDALQAELDESRRLLALRDQELSNLQNQLEANAALRAAGAEAPSAAAAVTDPGVDLESEQLFVDEDPVSEAESAAEPEVEAAPPPQAASPTPAQQPRAAAPAPEPTLVSRIMGWAASPVVWIVAGVVVVLLGAFAFLRRRRDDADELTGHWEELQLGADDEVAAEIEETRFEPVPRMRAEPDSEDFVVVEGRASSSPSKRSDAASTRTAKTAPAAPAAAAGRVDESRDDADDESPDLEDTLSSQTVINLDEADPAAEADFHLAYGLYDQAAELVNKALQDDPGNRSLKLKLLEVYFVWGNKDAFLDAAKDLRKEMGNRPDSDWDKVVIMGKQIHPDETLFAAASVGAGAIDLDLDAGTSEASALDLSFESDDEEPEAEVIDVQLEATNGGAVDPFEIGVETSAGVDAALFEIDDDDGDSDPAAVTREQPAIARSSDEADSSAATVETPAIASRKPTGESATVEQVKMHSSSATELTAELDLDDLGLDVSEIGDLPGDLGDLPIEDGPEADTQEQRAVDEDLLTATGVTQVLHDDDVESEHTGTAVLDQTSSMRAADIPIEDSTVEQPAVDLDLDDLSAALEGGDTVDQPAPRQTRTAAKAGAKSKPKAKGKTAADRADLELTKTEQMGSLDPQTMTEIGTKLDLARAYVDMGDPEGARSILDEVLDEGNNEQRQEAQSLIDLLSA